MNDYKRKCIVKNIEKNIETNIEKDIETNIKKNTETSIKNSIRCDRIYCFNGSFTVEAVFIIPIIFYITFMLIYMNFYLHDYSIMIAKVDYIVERYIETRDDKLIKEDALYMYLNKEIWFSEVDNIELDINYFKLKLKADISLKLPSKGIFKIFTVIRFNNTYEKEFLLLNRTEAARIFTVGINTLEKIKGLNEIIKKYYKK